MSFCTITIHYIGRSKERFGYPEQCAFGHDGRRWSVALAESALKAFFHQDNPNGGRVAENSLYGRLGVTAQASKADLKQAYRRLARQWHPDVCREPDAAKMFRSIDQAYKTLDDPLLRRRYDAGLKFEATIQGANQVEEHESDRWGYRCPLTCGQLKVSSNGEVRGKGEIRGKLWVDRIVEWNDITSPDGRMIMTSSWNRGEERYDIRWMPIEWEVG